MAGHRATFANSTFPNGSLRFVEKGDKLKIWSSVSRRILFCRRLEKPIWKFASTMVSTVRVSFLGTCFLRLLLAFDDHQTQPVCCLVTRSVFHLSPPTVHLDSFPTPYPTVKKVHPASLRAIQLCFANWCETTSQHFSVLNQQPCEHLNHFSFILQLGKSTSTG